MGRDDVWVPNRGVDVGSRPRRAGYSRGSFSVMPSPHQRGHERSLGQAFAPGSRAVREPVRPAFGLVLHGRFLTYLSRPLDAPDSLSGTCRPSRTAHLRLSLSFRPAKRFHTRWTVFHFRLHMTRRSCFIDSRLLYATGMKPQPEAAVKLHGVFSPRRGSQDCALGCRFTRPQAETVRPSLIHSCTSELTRQGIWLP